MPLWIKCYFFHLKKLTDMFVKPLDYFTWIVSTTSLLPALTTLITSSLLFMGTTILAHIHQIPYLHEPDWNFPAYRLLQAGLTLPIYSLGWLLCGTIIYMLTKIIRKRLTFKTILMVLGPALFFPLTVMSWPTELAYSIGIFDPRHEGFPVFWIKHLMPTLALLYTIFMLWLAFWQCFKILLREAFALVILSLIPTLFFWSLILR